MHDFFCVFLRFCPFVGLFVGVAYLCCSRVCSFVSLFSCLFVCLCVSVCACVCVCAVCVCVCVCVCVLQVLSHCHALIANILFWFFRVLSCGFVMEHELFALASGCVRSRAQMCTSAAFLLSVAFRNLVRSCWQRGRLHDCAILKSALAPACFVPLAGDLTVFGAHTGGRGFWTQDLCLLSCLQISFSMGGLPKKF